MYKYFVEFILVFGMVGNCFDDEFDCGRGYCVMKSALCDGFNDCLNYADERRCGNCSNNNII